MTKIDGIPDGYELVRVGFPHRGELYVSSTNNIVEAIEDHVTAGRVVVRKSFTIEPGKYYERRNGGTVGPVTKNESPCFKESHPFSCEGITYRADGKCSVGDREHNLDLVREADFTIQVKEGFWYERRDGVFVGPVQKGQMDRWLIGSEIYAQGGKHNSNHDRDLVREINARPFEGMAEFAPHRDKWVRFMGGTTTAKVSDYSDGRVSIGKVDASWRTAFASVVFDDDGSPFGVKLCDC